jgi:general secretion pathway protein J
MACWRRWQSLPFTTRGEWQQAWNLAAAWAQDGAGGGSAGPAGGYSDVMLMPASSWQLYLLPRKHLGAGGPVAHRRPIRPTPTTPRARSWPCPTACASCITLPPGDGLSGTLTRDWVKPTVGARS